MSRTGGLREAASGLRAVLLSAMVAAFLGASGRALASRVIAPTVTGQVTAVTGGNIIAIDGKQYTVAYGSAAAAQLSSVHVGDVVGLILDGPADSSASQVIAIQEGASQ